MRASRPLLLVPCVIALAACRPSPEAPEDLEALARYLFREWDAADAVVLEDGVGNLDAFLADVDLEADALDRSWALSDLEDGDVVDVERPDRALSDCTSVSLAGASPWPVSDHARVQTEADQTPFEPTAKDHHDRTFPDLDDPACFTDRGCDVLVTFNEATRKNILMEVTFELHKHFRWVRVPGDEERWAVLARSWFSEPWEGEGGRNTLWQSYAVDAWVGQPDGSTWRFQALWSESDLGIDVGETEVAAVVRGATDQIFRVTDEAIGERYHDGASPDQ